MRAGMVLGAHGWNVAGPSRAPRQRRPWRSLALGGRLLPCLRVPHSGPLPLAAASSQGKPLCSESASRAWHGGGAPTERHLDLGLPVGAQLCGSKPLFLCPSDPAALGGPSGPPARLSPGRECLFKPGEWSDASEVWLPEELAQAQAAPALTSRHV